MAKGGSTSSTSGFLSSPVPIRLHSTSSSNIEQKSKSMILSQLLTPFII